MLDMEESFLDGTERVKYDLVRYSAHRRQSEKMSEKLKPKDPFYVWH